MKSGLYIAKCYWKNTRTNEISPMLKYGYTSNIETRMFHYTKNGATYKLLSFFPCKDYLKERENYVQLEGPDCITDQFRCNRSEYIEFQTGYFKQMYNALKHASELYIYKFENHLIFE
jgi:hypothetical protein